MARVLVVDDEMLIAMCLEDQISQAGHDVVTASSAADAYSQLGETQRSFQALITDVDLGPGANGHDVASRARVLHPGLIVAYTSGRQENLRTAADEGALAFLKPYDVADVARQIDQRIKA